MAETVFAKLAVEVTAKATQFGKELSTQSKALKGFQNDVKGVSTFLKGAFATLGIGLIGKEIIDVTSEFQKFGAVLKNTLGSGSAASIALRDIEEFAKTTPFAVDELTSSFVKLANQGFVPTTDELRKLGDLASSTGKSFDQLSEAIIDAQTGEFERLKEFGIRAKKEGDNVKFTFKGVETQVKFTSDSIREYILSLGDAQGVSGSMAAISQTLGGQISNLGDSWTQFLKTVGDGNNGILSGAVSLLNLIIQRVTGLIKTNRQLREELKVEAQSSVVQEVKDLAKVSGDYEAAAAKVIARLEEEKEAIVLQATPLFKNFDANSKQIGILEQKAAVIEAQIQAINDLTSSQEKETAAQEANNEAKRVSLGLIPSLEAQIKALEDQKKKSFSTDEIAKFNAKIEELKDKLSVLNASRPLSNFGQKQLQDAINGITTDIDIDLGATPIIDPNNNPFAIPPPNVDAYMAGVSEIISAKKQAIEESIKGNKQIVDSDDETIDKQQQLKAATMSFGEAISASIGQAVQANESFAQSMKRVTAELLKTFLTRALGAAISTAFTSSGNPIIGAAVAGVAIGLVNSLFSRIGGPTKGGGGSISKQTTSSPAFKKDIAGEQIILVGGEFRLRGNDLALALEKTRTTKQRTG